MSDSPGQTVGDLPLEAQRGVICGRCGARLEEGDTICARCHTRHVSQQPAGDNRLRDWRAPLPQEWKTRPNPSSPN